MLFRPAAAPGLATAATLIVLRAPCATERVGPRPFRARPDGEPGRFTVTHGQAVTPLTCESADQRTRARSLPGWGGRCSRTTSSELGTLASAVTTLPARQGELSLGAGDGATLLDRLSSLCPAPRWTARKGSRAAAGPLCLLITVTSAVLAASLQLGPRLVVEEPVLADLPPGRMLEAHQGRHDGRSYRASCDEAGHRGVTGGTGPGPRELPAVIALWRAACWPPRLAHRSSGSAGICDGRSDPVPRWPQGPVPGAALACVRDGMSPTWRRAGMRRPLCRDCLVNRERSFA